MNLGRAPEGVGVLNPAAVLVGSHDFAVPDHTAHVVRRRGLAGMRPHLVNPRIKFRPAAQEHLQAHGRGDVRHFGKLRRVMDGKSPDRGRHLGPVHQGKTLAAFQVKRPHAASPEGFRPCHQSSIMECLPKTNQDQSQVRQWSQVPAGSHRSLFRDGGQYPLIEQVHEPLNGFQPYAGMTPCEILHPEGHHGPDGLLFEQIAQPRSVAHEDILLQEPGFLSGDDDVAQGPEAGGHSIDDPPF